MEPGGPGSSKLYQITNYRDANFVYVTIVAKLSNI